MQECDLTVSVIIPCYNGERYLQETISSALAQLHQPLEILVIDDGSTDGSAGIAESFGHPVRVFRQMNRGESVARNFGVAQSSGTHILFLDADDLLSSDALERMVTAIGDDPCAVAMCGYATFIDDSGEFVSENRPMVRSFFPTILSRNIGMPHCFLTPTAIVRKIGGFHPAMKYSEDWDFWCQVALAGGRLVPINYIGAKYRRHANAQSRNALPVERKLGHVLVVDRCIRGMLKQPALLEEHGESAFWSGWTALRTARELGVPWSQLKSLANSVHELVEVGPRRLRSSRFGRITRYLGLHAAMLLQSTMTPPPIRSAKRSGRTTTLEAEIGHE